MGYCDKHRRQHLDAGCSKCWEDEARAKAKPAVPAVNRLAVRPPVRPVANVKPAKGDAQRYRDPEKRRAYLRTYMRAYMAKQRGAT
jgi:hypothetical protein